MTITPGQLTITVIGPKLKDDGQSDITSTVIDHVPELEEIKGKAIDGLIELIPYFNKYNGDPCVAFCAEEGKLKGLRYNYVATALWCVAVGRPIGKDYLVGSIVIISGDPKMLERM